MELPPLGIYKINNDDFQNCYLFPWRPLDQDSNVQLERLKMHCNIGIRIISSIEHHQWSENELSIKKVKSS